MVEMESGKIYAIQYSGVLLIVRYKETNTREHHFFTHLHYWCGHENYHTGGYCGKSGIEEIRRATPAEKHALFRVEVAQGDV
jgi:hypothetical protein